MKISLCCALFLGLAYQGEAQSWELVASVSHANIDHLALDPLGNIYVANVEGVVAKYTSAAIKLQEYAPPQRAQVQKIVANTQLKVVLFYENLQEFVILDRYFTEPVRYRLIDFDLGYVEAIAPTYQPSVWVLDISDFSLKMIDLSNNDTIEKKSLAMILDQRIADILSFHAHQNRMYMIDQKLGVQVFDNIGNYLFQLSEVGPNDAGFNKDHLYYTEAGKLKLIHLYNGQNETLNLPLKKYLNYRYSAGRLIAVSDQGFDIYKYLSGQ